MPLVNLRKIRPQIRSRRLDTLRRVRIMGRAYITFIRAPSKTDLQRLLVGIRTNYLLFVYQVGGYAIGDSGVAGENSYHDTRRRPVAVARAYPKLPIGNSDIAISACYWSRASHHSVTRLSLVYLPL